jgi:hypothetical protein
MELDLFMEFASPPFARRDVAGVLDDGFALARAADAVGFGAVWLAEHHFLGDYCNAAAPDMLLAAMARETPRIGLGFGILPLPILDPVRVAERLATLYPTEASLAAAGLAEPRAVARAARACPERRRLARDCAAPALTLLARGALPAPLRAGDIRP